MLILYGLRLARASALESNTWIGPIVIGRRYSKQQELGEARSPGAAATFGRPSSAFRLMRRLGGALLLAALGASGQWRAAAVIVPPTTDRVALTWESLGSGTRYYVQTSTNLLTWTAATNTTVTNVSLAFIGNKARMFRLSVSNAPPPSVTLAWDPSPDPTVAGYSIYYGASTGSYTNLANVGLGTNGVVSNLLAGTTYYFAVTAHTAFGLESDFSNEAVWLAGRSPLQLRIQRLP